MSFPSPDNARTAIFRTSREACECVWCSDVVENLATLMSDQRKTHYEFVRCEPKLLKSYQTYVRASAEHCYRLFCTEISHLFLCHSRLDILDPDFRRLDTEINVVRFPLLYKRACPQEPLYPLGGPNVKSKPVDAFGVHNAQDWVHFPNLFGEPSSSL